MNIYAHILTPCPMEKHCRVCEGRIKSALGVPNTEGTTAKYRHQASQWQHEADRLFSHVLAIVECFADPFTRFQMPLEVQRTEIKSRVRYYLQAGSW